MEPEQSVVPGSRFGPYEILSSLGAGGMGEVYRARDPRLDRIVALKILAPDRSGDPDFRRRLHQEARALSRLSHPNICSVFDVGTEDSTDYFVMELLSGETLAERLRRGPLSLEQTLDVGGQIASALETCHRAGLVHRDLKPANVMLTPSGVKLLDFGIARFVTTALPSRETLTATMATGIRVGTLQYMSPEQLEAKDIDARSDLFSLGGVLFEMITGRRAFEGDTPTRVSAAILTEDPPSMLSLQPAAPRELERLIRSCLAKSPADRWQSAHDLGIELGWIAARVREPADRTANRARWSRLWIPAALGGIAAGMLVVQYALGRPPDRPPAVHAMILPPQDHQFNSVGTPAGPAVLSPDGRNLAFAASGPDSRSRLWIRSLNSVVSRTLSGTDGAAYPFWSPDGEQLGFFTDGKLKKIEIGSGKVTTLADARYGAGGTWNREGTIVFAPGLNVVLHRVSSDGGSPQPLTTLDAASRESAHRWPAFLPGGRRFLYAAGAPAGGRWTIRAGSLDSNQVVELTEAHSNALYANGFLIFLRNRTLLAQPLDERSLRVTGDPVPLGENIQHDLVIGRGVFSASETGTLAYQTGSAVAPSRLLWLDRTGKETKVLDDACLCIWPRLDPEGRRAAIARTDPGTGNVDIWVYGLGTGRRDPLTFDASTEAHPSWTSDGSRIVFTSTLKGFRDIYWKDALGSGAPELLHESNKNKFVSSVTRDRVVFNDTDGDFWLLPLPAGKAEHFRVSEHPAIFGQISPDGRWFLYQSAEGGKNQVWVTSLPDRHDKVLVSDNGGILPKWSADGREIFYLTQDHSTMFVATVGEEVSRFRVTSVQRLFSMQMVAGRGYPYDVSPDGKRFLVVAASGSTTTPLTLVVNWPSEVRR